MLAKILRGFWGVTVASLGLCTIASAETPNPRAIAAKTLLPTSLLIRPKDYLPDKNPYDDHFAAHDTEIANIYRNTWQFHEMYSKYGRLSDEGTLYLPAALAQTKREDTARQELAQTVLKLRFDRAVRNAITMKSKGVQKAMATMEKIKNIQLVGKPGKPQDTKLIFGYDVLTDTSNLRFHSQGYSLGVFHPHLTGSIYGGKSFDVMEFRVEAPLDANSNLRARTSYNLGSHQFAASLHKPLSRSTDAAIATRHTIIGTGTSHYELHLHFRF